MATQMYNTAEQLIDYNAYAEDSGALEFSEMTFRRALLVELKRAGRSNRPFILMLVSLAEMPVSNNGYSPRRLVVEALGASIRDTDMMGWYKSGRTVGVLLTEISGSSREALDAVMERLNDKLARSVSEEDLSKLSIAVYLLPGKVEQAAEQVQEGFENFGWPVRSFVPSVSMNSRRTYH